MQTLAMLVLLFGYYLLFFNFTVLTIWFVVFKEFKIQQHITQTESVTLKLKRCDCITRQYSTFSQFSGSGQSKKEALCNARSIFIKNCYETAPW